MISMPKKICSKMGQFWRSPNKWKRFTEYLKKNKNFILVIIVLLVAILLILGIFWFIYHLLCKIFPTLLSKIVIYLFPLFHPIKDNICPILLHRIPDLPQFMLDRKHWTPQKKCRKILLKVI
jgi:hypothetical protein